MTQDSKAAFLRALVTGKWLTTQQLEEALKVQSTILETGVAITLEEVLVRRGYLSPDQLANINASIGRGRTDIIPGFELIEKIGQGGMGTVYKARQLSMDRVVAVKILLPSFAHEPNAVERFLREAKMVGALSHPNLTAGIDAGYQNGVYYCVMEYIEGFTLAKLLENRKPLTWNDAMQITRQIAEVLRYAEQYGLVHRDVKPENIIIDTSGTAKLMDLGLAKLVEGPSKVTSLTKTGLIVGTPAYVSPEQAEGKAELDIRSDIYSLGLTVFEMLTGQMAYDGETPMAVLARRFQETPKYTLLERVGVPVSVVSIVKKMTERDPAKRFQKCSELLQAIDLSVRVSNSTTAMIKTPSVRKIS
jgi:serine/threonine-protein kinase